MNSIELAKKIRIDTINMTHISNASHIGAILSVVDIISVLYTDILKYDPKNPNMEERDYFILSKGHAGAAVYSVLANKGFFDKKLLNTYYSNNSIFSGHVSHKDVPGVEFSTGSLGHGGNVACGIALSKKLQKKSNKVYVILGDGECNEGTVWEFALFAAQHKLDNLYVIIDRNNQQGLGYCKDILNTENLLEKWKSFGFNTNEINGHNHNEIRKALSEYSKNIPNCIIAKTVKGKGISFMEDNLAWHYKSPQNQDYINALKEMEVDTVEEYIC